VGYDGIIFDLGNTLVPWGETQDRGLYVAIRRTYEDACGPVPDFHERATRARDTLIAARENSTLREVTVDDFLRELHGSEPPADLVDATARTITEVLPGLVTVPDGLGDLLDEIGRDRPLGILSNFVMAEPIHSLLERAGLRDRFAHVEVSATRGWMKPHPEPYRVVLEALGTAPERTLMVGDDFFADIVGATRAGMRTALTHQHREGPTHDDRAPDVRAELVIRDLTELLP